MASTVSEAESAPSALAPVVDAGRPRPPERIGATRARRLTGWVRGTQAYGPALVVSVILALVILPGLVVYKGNPTGFVHFGRKFAHQIVPPRNAVVDSAIGYDGQYFWALAQDPLLLRPQTLSAFRSAGFRLQRIAYPALAYTLAGGRPGATPWTLLAINLVVIFAVTLAFSHYARGRGWSGWWGLAVGLLPGFLFAAIGDLSDALAVAAMLGGLIMWQRRRRWPAAALLTLAVLAREPMTLAVVAVAVEALVSGWPYHLRHGALRTIARALWPVVTVPALAFGAWQVYIHIRFGGPIAAPSTAFQPPFAAIGGEIHNALHVGSFVRGAWDLAYLGLMIAGFGAAVSLVRGGLRAPAIAALLISLSLLVLSFGYEWSYTRLSAPLFACLLLAGLERRARPTLAICAAVAGLGALMPLIVA